MPLKILMQQKIMQTSGANSERNHSEVEHFLMLNELNKSKDSIIVTQLSLN